MWDALARLGLGGAPGNPPVKLAGLYIVRTGAVMGGATRLLDSR